MVYGQFRGRYAAELFFTRKAAQFSREDYPLSQPKITVVFGWRTSGFFSKKRPDCYHEFSFFSS